MPLIPGICLPTRMSVTALWIPPNGPRLHKKKTLVSPARNVPAAPFMADGSEFQIALKLHRLDFEGLADYDPSDLGLEVHEGVLPADFGFQRK